jgi:ubiquinone/menaquinone biosynthesis C-methylase UbiE
MAEDIKKLYRIRFPEVDRKSKNAIWRTLCRHFFSRYIKTTDSVLDIACGYGEFINNIEAAEKIAIDINKDTAELLIPDVKFHNTLATDLSFLPDHAVNVVFMSNFLEHLPTKVDVLKVFEECHRVLKPQGKLIIMGPNIRMVPGAYWDFFDHHLPLSHFTIAEGLQLTNFDVETCIPRFLPYTTRSILPQTSWLVRLYLMFPVAWRFMGKQFFVVGSSN